MGNGEQALRAHSPRLRGRNKTRRPRLTRREPSGPAPRILGVAYPSCANRKYLVTRVCPCSPRLTWRGPQLVCPARTYVLYTHRPPHVRSVRVRGARLLFGAHRCVPRLCPCHSEQNFPPEVPELSLCSHSAEPAPHSRRVSPQRGSPAGWARVSLAQPVADTPEGPCLRRWLLLPLCDVPGTAAAPSAESGHLVWPCRWGCCRVRPGLCVSGQLPGLRGACVSCRRQARSPLLGVRFTWDLQHRGRGRCWPWGLGAAPTP